MKLVEHLVRVGLGIEIGVRVRVIVRVLVMARARVRVTVRVRVRVRVRIGLRGHSGVEHLVGRLCVVVGETEPVVELATVVEDIG